MNTVSRKRLLPVDKLLLQRLLIGFLTGILIAFLITVFRSAHHVRPLSNYYTYSSYLASNGVKLHAMRTDGDNIEIKHITSNVTKTGNYGINGGFFWNGDLLSIAVINNRPLKGEPNDYGSGWFNIDYPKGTLVWDEVAQRFSVQIVKEAGELKVTDSNHYWAQGGVSMSLGSEEQWIEQAKKEDIPAFEKPKLRSGAVYDEQQKIWFIVSDKPCTVEQFRSAVKEVINPRHLVDGIFLDGDGSSQMKNDYVALKGDSREVYQMLSLKKK